MHPVKAGASFFPNMALHVAVPHILRHSFYLKTRQSLATAKNKFVSWGKSYSNVLTIFTTSIWTEFGWSEDLLWRNSFKMLMSREVHKTRENGNPVDYETKTRVLWEVLSLFIYSLIKSRKDRTMLLNCLKVLKVTRLKKIALKNKDAFERKEQKEN